MSEMGFFAFLASLSDRRSGASPQIGRWPPEMPMCQLLSRRTLPSWTMGCHSISNSGLPSVSSIMRS